MKLGMSMRLFKLAAVVGLCAGLAACGGGEDELSLDSIPPEVIYADAEAALNEGLPRTAARTFSEVERLYPYSEWARRAMIMSAFSFYEADDFAQSQSAARRFLDFYPADDDAAYARYLIALGYYEQIVDVGRDQQMTVDALQALRDVIESHPETPYARDAELKFDLALDHLAGKEMEIGRYYLKGGHYLAAINRFEVVIEEYQTTTHTEEALHRMVEAYTALGLDEEARRAAALLGHNFPGSPWYADTFALLGGDVPPGSILERDGIFSSIWRRVVRGEWL